MPATPILDREQALPKRKRSSVSFGLAIGAVIGILLSFAQDRYPQAIGNVSFPSLFGFFLAFMPCVLLHELGHLAAGAAIGFEFRWIMAGALMLAKEARGYRFRFVPANLIGGGATAMVPGTTSDLRRRFSIFGLGGPAVTILLFFPILLLPAGLARTCLLAANLAIALLTLIPFTANGNANDAKLLLFLSRGGPSSERLAAILYITAIDGSGIRPSLWPPDQVARLDAAPGEKAFRASARFLLYIRARDGGKPDGFGPVLENLLSEANAMRPDLRRTSFAEAAFYQGIYAGNAERARAWLEDARKVKGPVVRKEWDAACRAALAKAEGKTDEFRTHLAQAIAYLDRQPGGSGSLAAARARLAALQEAEWTTHLERAAGNAAR